MNPVVDLRSDTVTRPTPAMREAMARAPVGDDVFGDDPSVNELEARAAAVLGKEASLFVPSGTAANQIALCVHCRPGDDVLVGAGAHVMAFESGAGAAVAGVQFTVAAGDGLFAASEIAANFKTDSNPHFPPTRLVAVEDTHNRAGGRVWPMADLRAVAEAARARGLALHLDGARVHNAAVASGVPVAERVAPFDTVSMCFSKGLGAPVGSVLAGRRDAIQRARRYRKMLGGGMRQAGILAAAALHALEHHVGRLAEDHANARRFASVLAGARGIVVGTPETNIVMIDVDDAGVEAIAIRTGRVPAAPAETLAALARDRGVLFTLVGPRRLRAVTHLDVDAAACDRAATTLAAILG